MVINQSTVIRSRKNEAHIARSTWVFGAAGAIGSELFSISAVWYVVSQQGATGSLVLIPQLVCAVASGLFGKQVTRHVAPGRVMWCSEAARIVAASVAAVTTLAGGSVAFIVVAACLSLATRPHLDAALIASVSRRTSDALLAHRVASVLDGLFRSARLFAPAVVALVSLTLGDKYVPVLALASFVVALIASFPVVQAVRNDHSSAPPPAPDALTKPPIEGGARDASIPVPRRRWFVLTHIGQAVNAGAWHVGFTVGTALLFASSASTGLAGFGGLVVAYGLGNLVGSGLMTYLRSPHPMVLCWSSRAISAVGYLLLGLASRDAYWLLALGAFIAASGTPISDLSFLHIVQKMPFSNQTHPLRVKMTAEFSGMLVALCLAPFVLEAAQRPGLLLVCVGSLLLFTGVSALEFLREKKDDGHVADFA